MKIKEVLKKEFKIAFSLKTQSVWIRLAKWTVFIAFAYLLYKDKWFWAWSIGIPIVGIIMHFIYRWKTKRWTQSWGGWST